MLDESGPQSRVQNAGIESRIELEIYQYSPNNMQTPDQAAHNAVYLLSPGGLATAIWLN